MEKRNRCTTFMFNVDNIHLKVEQKRSKLDSRLVEARFVYGLVIIGLAMIRGEGESSPYAEVNGGNGSADDGESIREDKSGVRLARAVDKFSRAAASVLLPIIKSLSSLDPGEIEGLGEEVEEE